MILNNCSFKYLKRTVSIATVLADKGLLAQFAKRNEKLTGPCPLHGGDNPHALVVNLSKNIWYCFTGCNTGGDLIDFVQRLDNKPYRQIGHYLSSLSGAAPPHFASKPVNKKPFRPFTTGLPLNPYTQWLRQKGITPQTAARFEVGAYHGQGFLQNCIGLRLHDVFGNPLGYAGRRLDPQQAKAYGKWKFPSALPKSSLLYNYHRIRCGQVKNLVVVECPWGVMRLSQLRIPAVALLGTSISATQLYLLRSAASIVIMMDGDAAGQKAGHNLKAALKPHTSVHTFCLPTGCDPDDLTDDHLLDVCYLFLS